MTISADQRAALARAVSGLRRVFEEDYAALAEGKFGIHLTGRRAGEVEDVAALSLSSHDLAARAELVGVIDYLRGEGLSEREAVERMVREAVFTTVNRLLAIRVAEAIGVLPPSLAEGSRSEGFAEAIEGFPLLRDADDSDGYWTYLQICGDELSHAVPRLFDRRHPLSALLPSAEALEEAVGILAGSALTGVWVEPEALGWSYQFFNTQDERRAMRDASSAPRDSRELAVRNQFFTPAYVVDFLVQNTLGRRFRESGFNMELPLLLGDVDPGAPEVDLSDLAILDPAVGSGHFLLGAYELLERAWASEGVSSEDAAPRILGSMYGIEIDARAAQVAQAVLYLRARKASPHAALGPVSIVTARSLPSDVEVRDAVFGGLSAAARDILEGLDQLLVQAPVMGSLLRVEAYLNQAIHARLERPRLGDDLPRSLAEVERLVLAAAHRIAAEASSTPVERLFAADATDALGLVDLLTRRYDVVLMNPPFGAPAEGTKPFLKEQYPIAHHDLYAAFVHRGRELLRPGGYLGAITSRSGFFLTTLEEWRSELIPSLRCVADLGHGVLHDALVEVAAYVVGMGDSSSQIVVRRALEADDKALGMQVSDADFRLFPSDLLALPKSPLAYWVSPEIRGLFVDLPSCEGAGIDVRSGLSTHDDFRFLRAWWEVPRSLIGTDGWMPIGKGGDYRPFFPDIHLVVDWRHDAEDLRAHPTAVIRNQSYYDTPGMSWIYRTTSGFVGRALPRGCAFSYLGSSAFVDEQSIPNLVAWACSRIVKFLVSVFVAAGEGSSSGTAARTYEVWLIKAIPIPQELLENEQLASLFYRLYEIAAWPARSDETSPLFRGPHFSRREFERRCAEGMDDVARLDEIVLQAYGLSAKQRSELAQAEGGNPGSYPDDSDIDQQEFARLYEMNENQLARELVSWSGGARYLAVKSHFLDRSLELLAHRFQVHPRRLVDLRDEMGLEDLAATEAEAEATFSYLVGLAFGRWDARACNGSVSTEGPCEPLAPLPPGPSVMLNPTLHDNARHEAGDGPLRLPSDGLLFDEPGHEWDICAALEAAGQVAGAESGDLASSTARALGFGDVRAYVRQRLFDDHVARYSRSGRKAPIYWHLAVPSRDWAVWLYAPMLSREMLFAVQRAAQDKVERLAQAIRRLRNELEQEERREKRRQVEQAMDLLAEIEVFQSQAEAVAQSGWEPDLNDGIILNAAPLEDLFADTKWRKDIAKHREKMENGEYPWATVQREYFDRLGS